jgi:hypothetical protein
MVRVFASILNVKVSNFMNDIMCGQQWYVDRIFPYRNPRIRCLGLLCGLPRLGFYLA